MQVLFSQARVRALDILYSIVVLFYMSSILYRLLYASTCIKFYFLVNTPLHHYYSLIYFKAVVECRLDKEHRVSVYWKKDITMGNYP